MMRRKTDVIDLILAEHFRLIKKKGEKMRLDNEFEDIGDIESETDGITNRPDYCTLTDEMLEEE